MLHRVLMGDGHKSFLNNLQQRLFSQFEFDWALDISSVQSLLLQRAYALIILAWDVPAEDRLRLVEQCREVSVKSAVLVVSEPVAMSERVQALEAGVDDFVTRPVHMDELAARAKALVRRVEPEVKPGVRVGNLELAGDGDFYLSGQRIDLHLSEQRLLQVLARRSGRLVSKGMIDRAVKVSEGEELSANAIEQRMSRLRKILEHADAGVRITTVRGSGYVLEPVKQQPRRPANPAPDHDMRWSS